MKKLLFVLMVVTLIFMIGCEKPPTPPIVESGIVCAGGHYGVYYGVWSQTGCEGESIQAGTFWFNLNGRIFLLGEPVPFDSDNMAANIVKVYGKCPGKFVVEIAMKKSYLEEISKSIK